MKDFKKYTLKLFVGLLLLATAVSCDDFLEETNRSSLTDANALADPDSYDRFVANAYKELRNATRIYSLDFQGTDIATREDLIAGVDELNDYVNISAANDSITGYWRVYYRAILAANNVEIVSCLLYTSRRVYETGIYVVHKDIKQI